MKKLLFLIIMGFAALSYGIPACAQGSGNALTFNGSTQYIDLGTQVSDNCRTIEMWFKPSTTITGAIADVKTLICRDYLNGSGLNTNEFGLYFTPSSWSVANGGKLTFYRRVGTNGYWVYSNQTSWQANVWYHVAGVIDPAGGMRMYINGVLQNSTDPSTQPIQVQTGSATDMIAVATWGYWGAFSGNRFFDGDIDEIRFWTSARSQTLVREDMCHKVNPVQAVLRGYYRFDNSATTTLSDLSGNNFNGTLNNLAANAWHYSSAPIGDTSTYVYPASWAAQTLSLQYAPGDQFNVSAVTGAPAGAHIYRVASLPNSLTGLNSPLNDYYGVWMTGTTGTYSIFQDFSAFSNYCSSGCKQYASRNDNAVMSWTTITPAYNNCTLSKANESSVGVSYRAEYILDVANPVPPNVLGNDTTVCTNSPYTLSVTLPGATLQWSTGATASSISVSPGVYWLDATINGCTVRDSITIAFSPLAAVHLGNDTSLCQGAPLTLSASVAGATSYLWNTGQTSSSIGVSANGSYWVDVNENGCHTYDTINVSILPLPVFSLGSDTLLCSASSYSLNAPVGMNSYLWSTGQTSSSISVSTSGQVWAEVSNNGCTWRDTILVNISTPLQPSLGNDTALCGAALAISSNVANATGYLWSTGQTTSSITVSNSGNYWVDVDNGGCHASDTINVNFLPSPVFSLGNDTSLCASVTFSLNAPAGMTSYLWSTGQSTSSITVPGPGIYWAEVSNGTCTFRDSISISFAPVLQPALGNDTILCQGQPLTVSSGVANATGYLWSNGQTTSSISVGNSGTYWVDVNNSGCHATDTINVTFAPIPAFTLGNDTGLCSNSSLTLTTPPGMSSYLWSTGQSTPSITVSTSGTYWAEVSNGTCTFRDTISILFSPPLQPALGNDTSLCQGQPLTVSSGVANATGYLWNTGQTTASISVNTSGSYWIDVDNNGCHAYDTIDVTFLPLPVLSLGNDTSFCSVTPYVLNAPGGMDNYTWSTGQTSPAISTSTSGAYWVEVSLNGCSSSDTIQLSFTAIQAPSLGNDTTLCAGQQIALSVTDPLLSYLWSNGSTDMSIDVLSPGVYWVMAATGNCTAGDSITIQYLPPVDLGPDISLCNQSSEIILNAGISNAQYLWNTGATTESIAVSEEGTYWVNVNNGCSTSDTISVTGDIAGSMIYVPNSFTPNNNNRNDVFYAVGPDITTFHMQVFNRWGQLIFESYNINDGWDGTYKGNVVEGGTYVVRIVYTASCTLEQEFEKLTHVNVIR